jgi:uncharacterized membrane protein (UPF0127 family)
MAQKHRFSWSNSSGVHGAVVAGLMLCFGPTLAQQPALPAVALNAGIHVIQAEVAGTPVTRQQGLMRRKAMAQGAGMLFVFDHSEGHCMWMKNTLIPLSVAFIDDRGQIVNIADMQPLDETTHCASRPARYALEMNQGWFRKRGIVAGAAIQGLERFSAASVPNR